MNNIQRKLLEDKIKKICQNKVTIFDASPADSTAEDADEDFSEFFMEEIDKLLCPTPVRNVKICVLCQFFLSSYDANRYFGDIMEVTGACTFGCIRPQCPTEYCKAFKSRS